MALTPCPNCGCRCYRYLDHRVHGKTTCSECIWGTPAPHLHGGAMTTRRSSSSKGHKIEPLPEYRERRSDCSSGLRCPNRVQKEGWTSPLDGHRSPDYFVGGPSVYLGSYYYISGRAGRMALREMPLCRECGAKFAAKNGLELPALPEPAQS